MAPSVLAGGPSFGGGFNVGAAVIGGIRAAQTIKSIRDANSGHDPNGDSGRSFGPRGIRGGNGQNNYPQQQQQTYVRPHTNVLPQANAQPQPNIVPQKNVVLAKPIANTAMDTRVVEVTAADLDRVTNELKDQSTALLNDLGRRVTAEITTLIDKLPNGANLTPSERNAIRNAVESGNPEATANLMSPADRNTPAGRNLVDLATARQQIDVVRTALTNNTLTITDLVNLLDAVDGPLPADAQGLVGGIAINAQVTTWVATTPPGPQLIPVGNNVPIGLVPGLPPGRILPLGAQALVGMGPGGGTRIILGEGNVLQVAGLQAPIGPPVPNSEGDVYSGVVLGNGGGDPMNYNVNQTPFEMKPQFTQNLGAGSWLVEFDRGGAHGLARYTLTEGYYEFTPTEKGWDLFKQAFSATLENRNDFDFHYVLDNKPAVLAPGQKLDLAGDYPASVRFENGNGEFVTKRLRAGAFQVAVNEKAAFEIYPTDAIAATPKPQRMLGLGAPTILGGGGVPVATRGVTADGAAVSAGEADPAMVAAMNFQLPAGFRPIDPVAVLSAKKGKVAGGGKQPGAFSLFAASNEE